MDATQRSSATEEMDVPEERAGQYARIEEIGRGSQSAVWLALDGFLGRKVALKEILLEPSGDTATGATFATIDTEGGSTFNPATIVSPNLRFTLSHGDGSWSLFPLPQPDNSPPRESLSRILRDSGLEMRAVELVYAR
jgi:serine/threonine protein kinase